MLYLESIVPLIDAFPDGEATMTLIAWYREPLNQLQTGTTPKSMPSSSAR
jgi:hypothetical protein